MAILGHGARLHNKGGAQVCRLLLLWLVCVAACVVWDGDTVSLAQEAPEYQVKAAFLYNFTKFVEWPGTAFAATGGSFIIGVVGVDPFGPHLEKMVEGKTIEGRRIVIRRYKRVGDMQPCHLLFVARSERERLSQILARVGKSSTLTVGEVEQFPQRGGMINFVMQNKNVKFEINPDAAGRAGLKISSKLLRLAVKVH